MKLGVQLTAKAGPSLDSLSWLIKSWGGRQLLPSSGHRALSLVKKFTQTINYAIIHRSINVYFPPETGTQWHQSSTNTMSRFNTMLMTVPLQGFCHKTREHCQSTTTQCHASISRADDGSSARRPCHRTREPFLLQQKHNAMLQHPEQMAVQLPGVSATGQQHIKTNTNNAISCFSIIRR